MKTLIRLCCCFLAIASCTHIPYQSVTLTDTIIKEGDRMHQLNIGLLNKMFNQKSQMIDQFIQNEYIPAYAEEFAKRIPAGTDVKAELPGILKATLPKINLRRDSMQRVLEVQRLKLVDRLNADYTVFSNATTTLKNLLQSSVNADKERDSLFSRISSLTDKRIDLNQVEKSLDGYIGSAGRIAGNISDGVTHLNNSIDSILNK